MNETGLSLSLVSNKISEYHRCVGLEKKQGVSNELKSVFKNNFNNNLGITEFDNTVSILDALSEIDPKLSYKMLKCFARSEQKIEELMKVSSALQARGFLKKAEKVFEEACKITENTDSDSNEHSIEAYEITGYTDSDNEKYRAWVYQNLDTANFPDAQEILKKIIPLLEREKISSDLKISYTRVYMRTFTALADQGSPELTENFLREIENVPEGEFGKTLGLAISRLLTRNGHLGAAENVCTLIQDSFGCALILSHLRLLHSAALNLSLERSFERQEGPFDTDILMRGSVPVTYVNSSENEKVVSIAREYDLGNQSVEEVKRFLHHNELTFEMMKAVFKYAKKSQKMDFLFVLFKFLKFEEKEGQVNLSTFEECLASAELDCVFLSIKKELKKEYRLRKEGGKEKF